MYLKRGILALALLCAGSAYASTDTAQTAQQRLQIKIDELLKKRHGMGDDVNLVQVATILTPAAKLAAICESPVLSIIGNDKRLIGKRSVLAKCETHKHFVQIQVSAQGTWWVAKEDLPAGHVIEISDIEPQSGTLDQQATKLVFNANQIVGQTTSRAIHAGNPVLDNQLHQQWQLRAGQTVEILAAGEGFNIRSQGKALSNAAVNDTLKVQTRSGQTVSGKVNAQGEVVIYLRQ
jgi:flagella basal body P-ring formation protein FlgA